MKINISILLVVGVLFFSCKPSTEVEKVPLDENWANRISKLKPERIMDQGSTYLSVHSQVYSKNAHSMVGLTVSVNMRNTSLKDTVHIFETKYYDTHGKMIRNYLERPIYILPMETLQIIIPELDIEGGAGGNFMFDWAITDSSYAPIFDAVMISTLGQQGLSFKSYGVRLK